MKILKRTGIEKIEINLFVTFYNKKVAFVIKN